MGVWARISLPAKKILAALMLIALAAFVVGSMWYIWVTGASFNVTPTAGETIVSPEEDPVIFALVAIVSGGLALVMGGIGVMGLFRTIMEIRKNKESVSTKKNAG